MIIYLYLNKLEAPPSKFYLEYWKLFLASRLDYDKCGEFLQSHSYDISLEIRRDGFGATVQPCEVLSSLYCYFHPAIKISIIMAHYY